MSFRSKTLEEDATLSVSSRKIASGRCTADGRASRFPHQQMAPMQPKSTVSWTIKKWEWPAKVFSLRTGQHVSFAYLLVHIVSPEAQPQIIWLFCVPWVSQVFDCLCGVILLCYSVNRDELWTKLLQHIKPKLALQTSDHRFDLRQTLYTCWPQHFAVNDYLVEEAGSGFLTAAEHQAVENGGLYSS